MTIASRTRVRSLFHATVLVLVPGCASAPFAVPGVVDEDVVVTYRVTLDAPQTQMVEITIAFPAAADTEELMLPTWRPGRYTILDPVGTLREVQATSGDGTALAIAKTAKSAWRVETGGAEEVIVSYRIYANSLGDRTRHVDATHAFLSGSSVFLYVPRLRSARVRVEIDAPDGWTTATGLERAPDADTIFVADDYDVLVDSPLEIGLHDRHGFDVDGVPHEIVVWPRGVEYDLERLVEDFSAIVREHVAVFERVPYERYVFLIHAGTGGGGTEHLNSTIMQVPRSALEGSLDESDSYERFLGLVSHEFFHTWNVKQLRPAGIHPYDYQSENYTDLLWVAEGSTSYFGDLTLVRGELLEEKDYLKNLGKKIDSHRRLPGARVQSVAQASFDAWVSAGGPDSRNSQVSFYSQGELVSLLLDMQVRARTSNRSSYDDVLRTAFERYPLEGPGYRSADLIGVIDELTESSFSGFFVKYVGGTERLPLEEALLTVGLELHFKANKKDDDESAEEEEEEDVEAEEPKTGEEEPEEIPMKAYLGLRLGDGGSGSRVRGVLADGPAYTAGIVSGDEIVSMNGRRLRPGDLDDRLERMEPGERVRFHLLRMDRLEVVDVVLGMTADGAWSVRKVEEPTDAQRAAYESWCGREWPAEEEGEEETAETAETDAE